MEYDHPETITFLIEKKDEPSCLFNPETLDFRIRNK
jgi:hypothetical protein